ncbi:hypothetical protein LX36DRAFT_557719, partial [Colletotrichum falcatum]
IEEAITVVQEAVKATQEDHPDRTGQLNNLGVRIKGRCSRTNTMADLEEAIAVAQEAVKATPEDHPDRPARLSNLGVLL